ncbi:hypothetical protein LTR36_006177 [Oleoguttula mirabilis]|uniref:Metallo-beta-lactamase domain-containing protein n=1 Tax=Oleoguttula mirabilis TaxID=1507867 RepID=A0AAV9JCD9_9PEZI|nr:hypothetical protein LTR36_006177 [Oleoguttula mirabilis]
MSTFDGVVKEFPDIRIDYFRQSSEPSQPPLAYLLSHVHTDHLAGLESCNSPFIYCSRATREILLRLEKYPHRMNFAKGILETRKQTYRHLKKLLKPIPLETPTVLELAPNRSVRVTLFDANHCVGAVMFLIEGDGKAVLYTGDIRSEPWWVNALARHPLLIPYLSKGKQTPLKRLDTIYLDTTFAHKDEPYRHFQTKAEGLSELISAVSKYSKGTLFYFDSWTFGYEEVWQALSAHLGSQIHVDHYRYGLYNALANGAEPRAPEVSRLMGFHCGNHYQEGCLTSRPSQVHSCEKGTGCDIWKKDFVRITPIISRYKGVEMAELGAGGGQGDLDQHHDLEVGDTSLVGQLIALCATKLHGQPEHASVMEMLTSIINERVQSISLDGAVLNEDPAAIADEDEDLVFVDDLPLERLVPVLAKATAKSKQKLPQKNDPLSGRRRTSLTLVRPDGLPKQITFPYSRHSSYGELCDLLDVFKPKDIHPCTVDYSTWTPVHSMDFLFGHLYPGSVPTFSYDQKMLRVRGPSKQSFVSTSRPSTAGSATSGKQDSPENARSREGTSGVKSGVGPWGDYYLPPPLTSPRKRKSVEDSAAPEPDALVAIRKEAAAFEAKASSFEAKASSFTSGKRDAQNKRVASTMPTHWRNDYAEGANLGQPPDYARLSPPPAAKKRGSLPVSRASREPSVDLTEAIEQRRRYMMQRDSEQPLAGHARVALRQEAYCAALGSDILQWSDIGLVSTSSGHQIREEEL